MFLPFFVAFGSFRSFSPFIRLRHFSFLWMSGLPKPRPLKKCLFWKPKQLMATCLGTNQSWNKFWALFFCGRAFRDRHTEETMLNGRLFSN